MGNIIYPHRLLDLDLEQIRDIVNNSFFFTARRLEIDIPQLVAELENEAGKAISQITIDKAVDYVEDFMDDIMHTFNIKLDAHNFEKRRHNMKRGYLSVFNKPNELIFAHFQNCETRVISKPLVHALGSACEVSFDISVSRSDEMKYSLSKSQDPDRIKIRNIKDRRQLKYYFVKVLKEYGADERQIIENFDTAFGQNKSKALASLKKLPKIYRD